MKKTALLIGNDSYRDPRLAPLVVPCEDVRALSEVLADPAIGGFDAVKPLLNCDRAAAAREVERLFREAGRDDLVLLYFSGHGVLDRYGRLWLALAETDLDSPLASALRSDDLRDLMEQGTCRRQVLILDCCYSGAFARPAKDSGDAQAVTPQTFEGEGRVALLSSTATQRSYEGNQVDEAIERSLFTHHLVEGLKTGAAAPGEQRITEEALFLYAHDRVRAAGASMTPQRWVGRQHGRLVLARNPAWRPDPRALLPADLLEDLESPRVHVREGAVLALARLLTGRAPEQAAAARALLESRLELERDRFVYQEIQNTLGQEGAVPVIKPLRPSPFAPSPQKPPTRPRPADPEPFSVFRDPITYGGEGPEMVRLPAGEFLMGSAEGSPNARGYEMPQHRVRIPGPIAIGRFPVTFEEYDRFCARNEGKPPNDEGWGRGRRPAIGVTWHDAVAYCVWLSAQTGQTITADTVEQFFLQDIYELYPIDAERDAVSLALVGAVIDAFMAATG